MAYDLKKRQAHFWAGTCLRKRRYKNHDHAEQFASMSKKKTGINFRVYYCAQCSGFHLTKGDAING